MLRIFYDTNGYQSYPEILEMEPAEFAEFQKELLPGQICRIANEIDEIRVAQAEREKIREWYVKAIAEKYNQRLDWPSNRWFVEQVRPSLF